MLGGGGGQGWEVAGDRPSLDTDVALAIPDTFGGSRL